jgi:hypothetical protein
VESILTNEKYKGDALLQKSFTVDFLSKVTKRNQGEIPSYYVRNSHPAIVSAEVFDLVQHEFKRRRESGRVHRGDTCYSGKIICGDCGNFYGSKVWNSNNKYHRVIWQCNYKYKNEKRCTTPHLTEAQIQAAFVESINTVLRRKDEVLTACREVIAILSDTSSLDVEREKAQLHSDELKKALQEMIRENARTAQDQAEYDRRYGELADQYQRSTSQVSKLDGQILDHRVRCERLTAYMDALDGNQPIVEFNEGLWNATVETVTVRADKGRGGVLVFRWKDGGETECCAQK